MLKLEEHDRKIIEDGYGEYRWEKDDSVYGVNYKEAESRMKK